MSENIHASAVRLGSAGDAFRAPPETGILLLGPSGSGKSDLALRLIAAGATLVADDRTDLTLEDGALMASPPASLAGLLEIRGVGIVAVPHAARVRVVLAIDLIPDKAPVRMPHDLRFCPPPALAMAEAAWPALIRLDPFEISAPAKIAAAAANVSHGIGKADLKPI